MPINWGPSVYVCVFPFTGVRCGSGFADVFQDRVSLFILSILFFLDSTQLWGVRNLSQQTKLKTIKQVVFAQR